MGDEKLCGHVNLHSYGTDGNQDKLSCELLEGHEGEHGAKHFERGHFGGSVSQDISSNAKEVVIGHKIVPAEGGGEVAVEIMGFEGEFFRNWTDMAGTPANEIVPSKKQRAGVEIKPWDAPLEQIAVSSMNPPIAVPK